MLRIKNLQKSYGDTMPLRDVTMSVDNGDAVTIIGPSGTGKSTLLRCINLLERPTSGEIWLDGQEITSPDCDAAAVRRRVGMVFQSYNLFGHLTVIENLMVPQLDVLGKSKQEAYDKGIGLLRRVGLVEKALSYPDELSGGQQQRVAIARAMAMDPELLLLDEPTSALDPAMVGEVRSVVRNLASSGTTMIVVTHEMNFARSISNRMLFLDDGIIYEEGTPEQVLDHPKHERTRRFVRRLKVLELHIRSRDYDHIGMVGQIEDYCSKNQIPSDTARHIELVFEELVQQVILPGLKAPQVAVSIEYSEESGEVAIVARYNGPERDATQDADDLSMSIIRGVSSSIKWTPERKGDYTNTLVVRIAL